MRILNIKFSPKRFDTSLNKFDTPILDQYLNSQFKYK